MRTLYGTCPCGEPIELKRWRSGKRICVSCAIVVAVEHNAQMNRKSGRGWELWKQGIGRILAEESSATDRDDHGSEGIGSVDH